jgi:hypothetical protein
MIADYGGSIEVCYELATPIEIPLTPEVITLLKGENNIWTDAGTSEIKYKVDLQSYIQKLINEASAKVSTLSMSPLSLDKNALNDMEAVNPVIEIETDEEAEEMPIEEEPAESKEGSDSPIRTFTGIANN